MNAFPLYHPPFLGPLFSARPHQTYGKTLSPPNPFCPWVRLCYGLNLSCPPPPSISAIGSPPCRCPRFRWALQSPPLRLPCPSLHSTPGSRDMHPTTKFCRFWRTMTKVSFWAFVSPSFAGKVESSGQCSGLLSSGKARKESCAGQGQYKGLARTTFLRV